MPIAADDMSDRGARISLSRLAYLEVLDDEKGAAAAGFWTRAAAHFRALGIVVERVMTDNAKSFRGNDFQQALAATGARHRRIPIRCPQVNGKVERFNGTLAEECATTPSTAQTPPAPEHLRAWVHSYNHHRPHTALGGKPPISRVTNVPEDDSYTSRTTSTTDFDFRSTTMYAGVPSAFHVAHSSTP